MVDNKGFVMVKLTGFVFILFFLRMIKRFQNKINFSCGNILFICVQMCRYTNSTNYNLNYG